MNANAPRPTRFVARQRGATLLEILVALLILSLGILGMGALQTRAIKGNVSSMQRSQAVMLSYSILEAMRIDRAGAQAGTYNTGTFDTGTGLIDAKLCGPSTITGTTLRDNNLRDWLISIQLNLGQPGDTTSCGAIYCDTTSNPANCRIQVFWDDQRAGGLGNQMIETVSRL
ncbi:type IV pilus assembly protein PilV [Tibeticola sediminis]|uniref:Type IV pilus assembly protein PilV n=1 Tax=Tibeticola sediminis TaxID=1917811 RepID=A0A3N4U3D1_9BURK|nr:type IV pilus modification protein PilV [Tibeticola sediminis]RPE64962.1 type IV pilus assembly protein PilV [Tibeticola sediminis]